MPRLWSLNANHQVAPDGKAGAQLVQVWALQTTEVDAPTLERLWVCLSASEQAKVQTLTHLRTRHHFWVGRGCLRSLLGQALGRSPNSLTLVPGPQGKPALEGAGTLGFNLSHSGDWLVIALAYHQEVGVDVEQVRPLTNLAGLCRRCLTDAETATVMDLPPGQANTQFFRYWTAKEAYLKGLGVGLSLPLTTLELAISKDAIAPTPNLLVVNRGIAPGWYLYQWPLAPGYWAALAIGDGPVTTTPTLAVQYTTPKDLLQ